MIIFAIVVKTIKSSRLEYDKNEQVTHLQRTYFCVRVIKLRHQVVKLLRHNPDWKTSTIFSLKKNFMSTRNKSCFLKCCKEFFYCLQY